MFVDFVFRRISHYSGINLHKSRHIPGHRNFNRLSTLSTLFCIFFINSLPGRDWLLGRIQIVLVAASAQITGDCYRDGRESRSRYKKRYDRETLSTALGSTFLATV